jgi:hypothetical protein
MGRIKKKHETNHEASHENRKAILEALARVSSETSPSDDPADPTDDNSNGYYTLTSEEMAALISGNIEKIETWVSHLDQRHATWLLRWLIKENL